MSVGAHLAVRLDAPVSIERFRAAFPGPSSSFVLAGGGASARPSLDVASYMGAEPSATLRAWRSGARDAAGRVLANVMIERAGGAREEAAGVDPWGALRSFLAEPARDAETPRDDYPFPLRAGLVGYIGYECGQTVERLPCVPRPGPGMPDMAFALHRWCLATSRSTGHTWLSVLGLGPTRADAVADAEAIRAHVERRLRAAGPLPRPCQEGARGPLAIEATLDAATYRARVVSAKEHIERGDAFEICLTNAYLAPLAQDRAWPLFVELSRSNPAPFAAFLELPEGAIVSSSPERFLSLDASGVAESRPIKGTRPRGATPDEDARLARELRASEKDRAENTMIVDLVRNDLGRVCRYGTVEAPEVFSVEPYATVHQLVSTVRGQLAPGEDAVSLVRACFPPGSMTGAPKIEAMSILERLEPRERGVYAGALGWLDLGGAMDLSVVIRTAVVSNGVATFSAGGAIVADSEPEAELEEARQKARALVRALEAVHGDRAAPLDVEVRP